MNALEIYFYVCKHKPSFLVRWVSRTIIKVNHCCAFDVPNMESTSKRMADDSKPFTTFVHADTKNFKDVVQRLTGSSEEAANETTAVKGNLGVKKPDFKLHERRQYVPKLEIIKPTLNIKQGGAIWQQYFQEQKLQPQEQHKFSPSSSGNRVLQTSPMESPSQCFSSLSLAERANRDEVRTTDLHTQEEEKAIRERRFYLHPSPRSKPGSSEPELLSLFPLTSPGKMESQELTKESNNLLGK